MTPASVHEALTVAAKIAHEHMDLCLKMGDGEKARTAATIEDAILALRDSLASDIAAGQMPVSARTGGGATPKLSTPATSVHAAPQFAEWPDMPLLLRDSLPAAAQAVSEAFALKEMMPKELHPATKKLVLRFASALAEKLYAAEKKYGYSDGWEADDWMDECRAKLLHHIEKGDPRDVAAYCAFLWHHKQPTYAGVRTPLPSPADEPAAQGAGKQRLCAMLLEISRGALTAEPVVREACKDAYHALRAGAKVPEFVKIGALHRPRSGGVHFLQDAEVIPLGIHETLDVYMLAAAQDGREGKK